MLFRVVFAILVVFALIPGCAGEDGGPLGVVQQDAGDAPLAWSWTSPSPQGEDLNAVDEAEGLAVAVGDGGAIVLREPGARDWQNVVRPTKADLEGVSVMNGTRAVAVGQDGIYLSSNAGRSWRPVQAIGFGLGLRDVDSFGAQVCAVGDELLFFSNDGGDTWALASVDSDLLRVVSFSEPDFALVATGDGKLFRTADGGGTWDELATGQLPTFPRDMAFASARIGALITNSRLFRTINGGFDWAEIDLGAALPLQSVQFLNENVGTIMLRDGRTLETDDAGATWTSGRGFILASQEATDFLQSDEDSWTMIARRGQIHSTDDGGTVWTDRAPGDRGTFERIAFASAASGLILGSSSEVPEANALRTIDGGRSWQRLTVPADDPTAVSFLDESLGLVVSSDGRVLKTSDVGASWSDISPPDFPTSSEEFYAVTILDEDTYMIAGENFAVLKTDDAGLSWRPVIFAKTGTATGSGAVSRLTGIDHFPGTSTVIAVGAGVSMRSQDGGDNWAFISEFGSTVDVVCTTDTDAFAMTDRVIFRTQDGGDTWDDVLVIGDATLAPSFSVAGEVEQFNAIAMRGTRGVVVGPLGIAFETRDGGATWAPSQHVTTVTLLGAAVREDGTAFAVGRNGAIVTGR